jgi:hypothetical protein
LSFEAKRFSFREMGAFAKKLKKEKWGEEPADERPMEVDDE